MAAAVYTAVIFVATLLGAFVGLGGGVVIKPVLDAIGLDPVDTVSFLSSVAVFSMSVSSTARHIVKKTPFETRIILLLSAGSAAGGLIGDLLFRALLLAHGGLTTLGANTFSMAIAGPFVSWGVYSLLKKCRVNPAVSIGIACALGDLFTYVVTSLQLGFSHPSVVGGVGASIAEFMGIFAVTQIPLAVIEGILSAVVYMLLQSFAKPELREIGMLQEVK